MSLEYCMHSSLLAYVCFQHASCLLYIAMKQVIYSVHSCMVSLVYVWLCIRSPQACNNNNNNILTLRMALQKLCHFITRFVYILADLYHEKLAEISAILGFSTWHQT